MEYMYVIGPTPHDNVEEWRNKGNGRWFCRADCMESALETIFGSMPVPAELTGRAYDAPFVEGVCLPLPAEEVIQVWSTEPAATAHRDKMKQAGYEYLPHFGGDSVEKGGLLCEIPVYELDRYLHPDRKLLTAPAQDGDAPSAVSPIGATIENFVAHKHELMSQVAEKQWDITVQKWEMEAVQKGLAKQMREMQEQMNLAEVYLHGIKSKTQLFQGERGTGPYRVFQRRQFLNKEVALLANLTDFDFQNIPALDEWLVKEGKLWKLLPFERTILVTRIRDTRKDYGCPWTNMQMDALNMVSIIWIRDGKNVYRINVEIDFENCVFPDGSEAKKLIDYVTERVFDKTYQAKSTDWMGNPISKEPEGVIRKDAVKVECPYNVRTKFPMRFASIEEWLKSDDYTTTIGVEIAKSCNKYLTASNRQHMKFVLLLQGLVDTTNFLDIPKGTNLFDWEQCKNFFVLLNDYTHGLPDGENRDIIAAATDLAQLHVGETIIARGHDFEENDPRYRHQERYRYSVGQSMQWRFYTIVSLKDGVSVVHHFRGLRYPHNPMKKSERVTLVKGQPFLRASMPQSIVDRMLEDRDWKEKNLDLVPVLAQWKYVQEQYDKSKNFSVCNLKSPDGEDYGN